MRTCYNEACGGSSSTLDADLELCEKYGFDDIEINTGMLREYLDDHSIDELKEWFASHRLKAYSIAPVFLYKDLFSANDDAERNSAFMDEFMFVLESAQALGVSTIVVVPPMAENGQYLGFKDQIIDDLADMLSKLSDIALDTAPDVKLAFEPVGLAKCAVRSISVAKDILYIAYRKNLVLAIDAYNLFLNGGSNDFSDVAGLEAEDIGIVHIMNADDVPEAERGQDKRTFPYPEGAVRLDRFMTALEQTGFDGVISVETFRPEYYTWEAGSVVKEAYKSLSELFKSCAQSG